jgi:hypothetical protein
MMVIRFLMLSDQKPVNDHSKDSNNTTCLNFKTIIENTYQLIIVSFKCLLQPSVYYSNQEVLNSLRFLTARLMIFRIPENQLIFI